MFQSLVTVVLTSCTYVIKEASKGAERDVEIYVEQPNEEKEVKFFITFVDEIHSSPCVLDHRRLVYLVSFLHHY